MINDWLIYGTEKQYRDIDYVFDYNIVNYSNELSEIKSLINDNKGIILCGKDKHEIMSIFVEEYGRERVLLDDEIIDKLNLSIKDIALNKSVYIWGTGYWCDRLHEEEMFLKQNIEVAGYIDNSVERIDGYKNGKRIYDKHILNPENDFVIVATDEVNFQNIKRDLRKLGYNDNDYIYFRFIIDDIAEMFRKVYCCDTYYNVNCKNKDRAVRINNRGYVSTCCMAYDSILGNILWDSFENIWKSKKAEVTRLSLENHTYVFCDKERCPFLSGCDTSGYVSGKKYEKQEREYPESIAPEIDNTCNLMCTSCRNSIICQENDYLSFWTNKIIEDIVNLPVRLIINTIGEPFASKYCKRIIYSDVTTRRSNISIYTNGTLLSRDVLNRLLMLYDTIELAVSIDAYYEDTYKKIRRMGNFNKLNDNIRYVMEQRRKNKVSYIQLNYVLQKDNVAEMEKFIQWGTQLGVDCIAINAIENWGMFTDEEYKDVSIIYNGTIKAEYAKYFTKEVLSNKKVSFHNLSNYIHVEPKRMYMI